MQPASRSKKTHAENILGSQFWDLKVHRIALRLQIQSGAHNTLRIGYRIKYKFQLGQHWHDNFPIYLTTNKGHRAGIDQKAKIRLYFSNIQRKFT